MSLAAHDVEPMFKMMVYRLLAENKLVQVASLDNAVPKLYVYTFCFNCYSNAFQKLCSYIQGSHPSGKH